MSEFPCQLCGRSYAPHKALCPSKVAPRVPRAPSVPTLDATPSILPEADREFILQALAKSERRIVDRVSLLERDLLTVVQRDLTQESRLQSLESALRSDAKTSGTRAGITWGTAMSTVFAIVVWAVQELQKGNGPWGP